MNEIKVFESLLNILKQHDDLNFIRVDKTNIDPSYLHNNDILIELYNQFDLSNLIVETGMSSLSFIDYSNLKQRNNTYSFSSLQEKDYIILIEKVGGGEPILLNFRENVSPVIYATYDVFEPFKIADNLSQFINALTVIVDIVYNEYAIYEIYTNDDCDELKPDILPKVKMKLFPILGENAGNFMKYFYG
ncbi:hypothetical protein [Commensalibacter communis]|uniref:hypothetical protein n=1 Tax=Commensalibacter communis TaxID=2972786 RepID=UPI002330AA0F|nr:hypothetical protein [Commensalibacter communis]